MKILNNKYKPLFDDKTRYYILTGGRASGKSYAINYLALFLTFEKGQNVLFTRYTMTSTKTSIIPDFRSAIEEMGLENAFTINNTEIVNNQTGNILYFRGIKTGSGNQTAALKSLSNIGTWICEEAEEIPDFDTFNKINLSVRSNEVHNRVVLALNPATKEHWIYKNFYQDRGVEGGANTVQGDTTYIHTSYLDVKKHLPESILADFDRMRLQQPKKYNSVILGGWLHKAEGVIFDNWRIGSYQSQGVDVYGADFGFSTDASTLIKTSIDKKNKVIYVDEQLCKTNLNTSQLGAIFQDKAGKNLIIADSAEPRLISELKRYCNIRPSEKGQGSVSGGIANLLDYEIVVTRNSLNLIKELNNYVWDDKKSGTPKQNGYDHCIDALRYAVQSQLAKPNAGKYFTY